jgi:zinc transport system substrate-binding protein
MLMRSKIRNPNSKIIGLFCAIMALCLPFTSTAGNETSSKLTIYVVSYPLKYFAERIAGDKATVVFPAPSEGDPAYWMPNAKTITKYQQADLILLNGARYAKWVKKVSLPRSKMVDTSASFKDRYITAEEITTHSHGAEGKHAHESLAFTTWLDFDLATKQAEAIAKALVRKKPDLRETFHQNFVSLEKELMALDQKIKQIVSKNQQQPLIASHPVYDYFAESYGLNMKSVHWEPDEIPNQEQWIELRDILKEHPAKWMIWEGVPIKACVEELKSMGISSLVFDPCGNVPEKADFLAVMKQNIENLKLVF